MRKTPVIILLLLLSPLMYSLNMHIKETKQLDKDTSYFLYEAADFPLKAHVILMPIDSINMKMVPALGQREEVSHIAKRCNPFIAINGCNYRRGGKYNGNRANLCYLDNQLYTDLQLPRGSIGWSSKTHQLIIDTIFLQTYFSINGVHFPIHHINQPRTAGSANVYTDLADPILLTHTPGKNIIIDAHGMVHHITDENPFHIKKDWLMYQIDKNAEISAAIGMNAEFSYQLCSTTSDAMYNDADFIVGGAGLLIFEGKNVSHQLYEEFSQGTAVVHCGDEDVADFLTRKEQERLVDIAHPRTAIGITGDQKICILVVDGRQEASKGLTLHELAECMEQFDCKYALNIGGGGCSTLVINHEVVNSPSGGTTNPATGQERPVSEAFCFFKRSHQS